MEDLRESTGEGEGRREPAAVFLWGTGHKTRGLDLEELRSRWRPEVRSEVRPEVSLFPWSSSWIWRLEQSNELEEGGLK